jgi:hypothetical protein
MDQATDLTLRCIAHDLNKACLFPNFLVHCGISRFKLEFLWIRRRILLYLALRTI